MKKIIQLIKAYLLDEEGSLIIASLIIAAASTATAIHQNNQRIQAARKAKSDAKQKAIEEQNKLIDEKAKKRRIHMSESSTVLGGNTPSQGTVLTAMDSEKSSLLGG